MEITTQSQRNEIEDFIQTELLKRGFTAKLRNFREENGSIRFESESFQTTPVLFRSMYLGNFSSSIGKPVENKEHGATYRPFWIQVNIAYENFGGGRNSTTLFEVRGNLWNEAKINPRVYDLSIK